MLEPTQLRAVHNNVIDEMTTENHVSNKYLIAMPPETAKFLVAVFLTADQTRSIKAALLGTAVLLLQ